MEHHLLEPYYRKELREAGCDEAGRGCLAGPVVAAAVILPDNFSCPGLDDSKKLTEKQRTRIRYLIEEKAVAWAVGMTSNDEIDEINILNASFLAMNRAVLQLTHEPELLLVDGNRFRTHLKIPFSCFVKGDARFASIAAASVLAKTHRDELMLQLHREFPCYGWDHNKGYPTPDHRKAIMEFGISVFHRKSFRLINTQMMLNL